MGKKRIALTKHAGERFLERKIPLSDLEKMIEKGTVLGEVNGETVRVYKEGHDKYYTLIVNEDSDQITVITGYESSKWQIEQYHKVKKR